MNKSCNFCEKPAKYIANTIDIINCPDCGESIDTEQIYICDFRCDDMYYEIDEITKVNSGYKVVYFGLDECNNCGSRSGAKMILNAQKLT